MDDISHINLAKNEVIEDLVHNMVANFWDEAVGWK